MAIFTALIAALPFAGAVTIFGLSPGISAALIGLGKSLLWSAASAAIAGKPKAAAQEVQATLSQATAPRVRGYGEYLLGGIRAVWESKDGTLYQVVAMHHGEVSEVVGWYVDGDPVTFDAAGEATSGSAVGYLNVKHIISGDGGDYPDVRAAFPAIWTTDHKLTGIASYRVKMKAPGLSSLSKIFPRQDQTNVQMVAKLSEVLDPRTETTGYSDLTGLCVLDYLTHPDGYRIPAAAIDMPSFAQFANLCDENVPLKDGGTEKRYRVGGHYTLEDAPKDVTSRLLATANAQVFMTPEGLVGILGGEWLEPDVTITSQDILEFSLSDGTDEFTDFNVLKGIFMSPDHRYQEADAEEMRDEVALLTQPERVDTHAVDMCPSFGQMRRLMKCRWVENHREWTGTIKTNLVGLKARFPRGRGRHVIRLVIDELDIDQAFEVLGHSYSVSDRICEITVASLENPYEWDAEAEEGTPPPPLDDLVDGESAIDPPSGLVLTQEIVALSAGQNASRIVAVIDDPGRDDLQLYLQYQVVVPDPAESNGPWQAMAVGDGDLRGYSDIVSDLRTYNVRASWVGRSDHSASESISIISNPTSPAAPTGLAVSGGAKVSWTNGLAGYHAARIYRGDSALFSAASIIAEPFGIAGAEQSYQDSPGSGTWYYWVVTINSSLIESAPTGPVSETI
jgi:hypothetical protein